MKLKILTINEKSVVIGLYRMGNTNAVIAAIMDVDTEYIDAVIHTYSLVKRHVVSDFERKNFK